MEETLQFFTTPHLPKETSHLGSVLANQQLRDPCKWPTSLGLSSVSSVRASPRQQAPCKLQRNPKHTPTYNYQWDSSPCGRSMALWSRPRQIVEQDWQLYDEPFESQKAEALPMGLTFYYPRGRFVLSLNTQDRSWAMFCHIKRKLLRLNECWMQKQLL